MNLHAFFKLILVLSMSVISTLLHAQDSKPLDKHSIRITPQQQQKLGIQVAPLSTSGALTSQRLPGEVVIPAHQQRIVSAVQTGLVDTLDVAVGDTVKKGQVLGHMTTSDMLAPQQQYLQARIQLQLAQKTLARDAELFKDGIIAERRYLATKSSVDEVRATVTQLRQLLALGGMSHAAITQLEHTGKYSTGLSLVAPIEGVITEQTVAVGQRVDAASMLFKIAKLHPLWLEIHAPIEQASGISRGMTVKLPKFSAEGKVVTVIRSLNKQDQTLLIRAEITQNTALLSPGQFVEAELSSPQHLTPAAPQFSVAQTAITRRGQQTYLFVKTATGFAPTPITVVAEQHNKVTIKPHPSAPLKGHEQVAVVGTVAIKAAWDAQSGAQ